MPEMKEATVKRYIKQLNSAGVLQSKYSRKANAYIPLGFDIVEPTYNISTKNSIGKLRRLCILMHGLYEFDMEVPLFFRTTDEMLNEFDYLGEEKAFEVVDKNTNATAYMIEADICPIPEGSFAPLIPEAEEELMHICWDKAQELYGESLPEIVEKRLKRELDLIAKHGFSSNYIIASKLGKILEDNGYHVRSHGAVESSLAF